MATVNSPAMAPTPVEFIVVTGDRGADQNDSDSHDEEEMGSSSASQSEAPKRKRSDDSDEDRSDKDPEDKVKQEIVSIINDFFATIHENDYLLATEERAVYDIIRTRPFAVLELAYERVDLDPESQATRRWRFIYEEASLHAVNLIISEEEKKKKKEEEKEGKEQSRNRTKRRRSLSNKIRNWSEVLNDIVTLLDKGMALAVEGDVKKPFKEVYKDVFAALYKYHDATVPRPINSKFICHPPEPLVTFCPVGKSGGIPMSSFVQYMNGRNLPIIMTGLISNWPALSNWDEPEYLLRKTLGGRRMVPIELGRSYTDENWSQEFMSFGRFLNEYILSDHPDNIGYMAQHDLLSQVPSLYQDITVPDYCYTDVPPPPVTTHIAGRASQELDKPLIKSWLGPKGTISTLHTDMYYNILSQVVGYKYVRLYPPGETSKLYPRGKDNLGIDWSNTSKVDLSFATRNDSRNAKWPGFDDAKYLETILGPGECLYIPAGWWHCIESLTISFSVSFWWS